MSGWRATIAGYCILINVFLALFGIFIGDAYMVGLALVCIMLVSLPIVIQEHYEEKEDKEKNRRKQEED